MFTRDGKVFKNLLASEEMNELSSEEWKDIRDACKNIMVHMGIYYNREFPMEGNCSEYLNIIGEILFFRGLDFDNDDKLRIRIVDRQGCVSCCMWFCIKEDKILFVMEFPLLGRSSFHKPHVSSVLCLIGALKIKITSMCGVKCALSVER